MKGRGEGPADESQIYHRNHTTPKLDSLPPYLNDILLDLARIVKSPVPNPPSASNPSGPFSFSAFEMLAFLMLIKISLQYLILSINRWCSLASAGSETGGRRDLVMISESDQRVRTFSLSM